MTELKLKHKTSLDLQKIRADFPILSRKVNNHDLIYFDNGATAQKPLPVIKALEKYYSFQNANIHRGVHLLSQEMTVIYENARETIRRHINAAHAEEVIFTSGTTESINLVAYSFGKSFILKGDEIIISALEHHSNILPWQQLCEDKGAVLKVIPINDDGELDMAEYEKLLTDRTRLVAVAHISNTLGTILPIKQIIEKAHKKNSYVLIDGAQAVSHTSVDVQDLDADFYCFSGHKLFGPTGIGVLYGRLSLLDKMPPYKVGGGTIKTVTFEKTEYAGTPLKFEAGTPHIAGAIGLAAAVDYINEIGLDKISAYESDLEKYASTELQKIDGLRIIGTAKNKASVISFVVDGIHAFDIGTILDQLGIAVRTGHHCTQPLMERYCIQGTVRVSIAFYNTKEEIDLLKAGIEKALKMLR